MMNEIVATMFTYLKPIITVISWRDLLEIATLSSIFYYVAVWLKKDRDKNLLPYFYSFLCIIFSAHMLQLSTLTSFLLIFSPAVALLFMLMHQQTLQRNLIALKNVTVSAQHPASDWLSSIMKATLRMLSHNKDTLILIEQTDALSSYIHAPEILDVPITQGIISLLFNQIYNPQQICWITSSGTLRGINVNFKASWHPTSYQTHQAWIDDAIAYTTRTDALILHVNAEKHQYAIASHGEITEGLTMEQARQLIQKKIQYSIPLPKKGFSHGVTQQKKATQCSP